ncbi:MAG: septum site-determining protein MinD [Caldisericales bacterium]|jgi:septum site-determining protein MinD|nr:septum site-determining protein MinD [bacterium]
MGRSIVVTSGKGGVGKTTLTANLGYGLSLEGKKVVLVDTDIGLRNLDVILGLENRVVYDVVNVAEGTCELQQALVKDKRLGSSLFLLPAAQTRKKEDISNDQLKQIVTALKKAFDYVILDCPAGIEHGFNNAVNSADEAVVVVTPEVSSVRDADRVIGLLESAGVNDISLVVNRIKPEMVSSGEMMSVEDVLDILAVRLLGVIPEDRQVIVSTNKGEPIILNEKSLATSAIKAIVNRLEGREVPIPTFGKRGFWARLSDAITGRRNQ